MSKTLESIWKEYCGSGNTNICIKFTDSNQNECYLPDVNCNIADRIIEEIKDQFDYKEKS